MVPISFEVREILELVDLRPDAGLSALTIRRVASPFVKDYDASAANRPGSWQSRFDLAHWGFFAARSSGERVGGAAVATHTGTSHMGEGRLDLAVLWDIRVAPIARRLGVGSALLRAAEAWAFERGVGWLEVETQNINVPAYLFYTRHGFILRQIIPDAYPEHPQEIQLVLRKPLAAPAV